MAGSLEFLEGRRFSGPEAREAIIDDRHARSNGLAVGDRFDLKGQSFQVVGIYRNGVGGRIYVPIRSLQTITDKAGQASTFLAKLYESGQLQAAMAQMRDLVPQHQRYLHAGVGFPAEKRSPPPLTPPSSPG